MRAVMLDDVEEWKQAAQIEAGLRREYQEQNAKLVAALRAVRAYILDDRNDLDSWDATLKQIDDALTRS